MDREAVTPTATTKGNQMPLPTTTTHHADCRFLEGSGWCCAPACGRITVPMHKHGNLTAAFPTATYADRIGAYDPSITYDTFGVELWFQSPDGDQSDVAIFHLRCLSGAQAEAVAAMHREVWDIPAYGGADTDVDGIPNARRDTIGGPVPIV
jgi:hypothetical protein